MAETLFTANLLVSTWGRSLFREAEKEIYFKRFMGESKNSIIQVKNELKGKEGDDITFGLLVNLIGSGVTGDSTLEGAEESMVTYDQNVTIDQVRNAVRSRGRLHDRSHYYDFRNNGRDLLSIWLAEFIDSDIYDKLVASPTRALGEDTAGTYRFDGTYKSSLAAADYITPQGISICRKLARVPSGSTELKIRPVKVDGRSYYVLLISEEQRVDLHIDATFAQASREARDRGKDNPIFSGADYVWDGVVIHSHENIAIFTDGGGASVRGSLALFMGAQAGIYAKADEPLWDEKTFDFGAKRGIAAGVIYGVAKTKFNSEDLGTLIYCTSSRTYA